MAGSPHGAHVVEGVAEWADERRHVCLGEGPWFLVAEHPASNDCCRCRRVWRVDEGPGLFEGVVGVWGGPVFDGVALVVALEGAVDRDALAPSLD